MESLNKILYLVLNLVHAMWKYNKKEMCFREKYSVHCKTFCKTFDCSTSFIFYHLNSRIFIALVIIWYIYIYIYILIYWYIYQLQLGCHPVAVHIYTQTIHRTTQITTERQKWQLMCKSMGRKPCTEKKIFRYKCDYFGRRTAHYSDK